MPDLAIRACGAEAVRSAVLPTIGLNLQVDNLPAGQAVESVILHCQIQIEAARRRYEKEEQAALRDLFGEPERWDQTLRPLLWCNLTTTVPGFSGSIGFQLSVPCPSDLNFTASKYFHGVEGRDIPLSLLFSGTIFYRTDSGQLQAAPIPWNTEARYALPAGIWKQCMQLHHPNMVWLGLRRDVFERLYEFKVQAGLPTFDEAVERILEHALEPEV